MRLEKQYACQPVSSIIIHPPTTQECTHHINSIDGAQLERLVLGVQDDVDHGAHVGRHDVVGGDEADALLQPLLVRLVGPAARRSARGHGAVR